MQLQELFRQLSVSEFSNISLGDKGAGTIRESDRAAVVVHTNDALLILHSKFNLREKLVLIDEISGKTTYRISSDHALSSGNPVEPVFIRDSEHTPFEDDFICAIDAQDSEGNEYVFNQRDNKNSLFTPEPDIIQIPYAKTGRTMGIVYQAKAKDIVQGANEEIELPAILVPALRCYIAHLVYSGMNGQQNIALGELHLVRFEEHCERISQTNLLNSGWSASNKNFENNGWV